MLRLRWPRLMPTPRPPPSRARQEPLFGQAPDETKPATLRSQERRIASGNRRAWRAKLVARRRRAAGHPLEHSGVDKTAGLHRVHVCAAGPKPLVNHRDQSQRAACTRHQSPSWNPNLTRKSRPRSRRKYHRYHHRAHCPRVRKGPACSAKLHHGGRKARRELKSCAKSRYLSRPSVMSRWRVATQCLGLRSRMSLKG